MDRKHWMNDRAPIPKESRLAVLTETGYRCASPNCTHELTVDVHHIVEVRNGGGHTPDNLLPLCPYCHDKYHRNLIDQRSVVAWKDRARRIYQAHTERPEQHRDSHPTHGYATAFSKFTQRTYPIWYCYNYNDRMKFYPAGYATYVDKNRLVTSRAVLDRVDAIREKIPGGTPKLALGSAALSFAVEEIHTWGGIAILKSSSIEERDVLVPESSVSLPWAPPDDSPFLNIAQVPFIGQEVAFLYGSHSTDNHYPIWRYAIGSSLVTSFLATEPISLDRYVLSPIQDPVDLLGGPVFLHDGTLVGVLTALQNGETLENRTASPPLILGGFLGVKRLWKKD